jgi:hypothetical protein
LIFARLEWWVARRIPQTNGWTEVNNGIGGRLLGMVEAWPDDTFFDIVVNGKKIIITKK